MRDMAETVPGFAALVPFSRSEYERRWQRVADEMARRGLPAAGVWGKTASSFDRAGDVLYLTHYFSTKVGQGFDAAPFSARAFCAVTLRVGEIPILVADDPDVRPDAVATDHVVAAADPVAKVAEVLSGLGVTGEVGMVGTDFFPMKYWAQLQEATPGIQWRHEDDLVRKLRMVKSPAECDVIREAGALASGAMTRMMEALIAGRTEREAAALAAHDVVLGGGVMDKIQISHGETIGYTCGDPLSGCRDLAPAPGDMVRAFLIGPFRHGSYLDPGRTAVSGRRPDAGQAQLLEATAGIIEAIVQAIRPGVSFLEAAQIGDQMVAEFCPDTDPAAEKFPFFGHPHGLYFEGPPYISSVLAHQDARFEEGMLIGVEAFLARRGVGNAGFEQNYLVTADGLELVTTTPMLWH